MSQTSRKEAVAQVGQWCVDMLEINGLNPRPVGSAYVEVLHEGHVLAIEVHGVNKPWMFPRKGEHNPYAAGLVNPKAAPIPTAADLCSCEPYWPVDDPRHICTCGAFEHWDAAEADRPGAAT